MDLKLPTAPHFACLMRLPGCTALPHSQLLCASRRHSPPMCHAVSANQPSAPARIDVLTQQYQGLLAPAKSKAASSSTSGRKSTQSSTTAKQKSNSLGRNAGSRIGGKAEKVSSSDRPGAAAQHSSHSRSAASAGRKTKQTHGTAVSSSTSNGGSSSNSKHSSSTSSKAFRVSQDKTKPNSSGNSQQTGKQTATAAPAQHVILSGKGFGTVAAAPPSSSSSSHNTSSGSHDTSSSSNSSSSSSRSRKTIKMFRFGVEAAAIQKAIQQNGWEDRVEQVEQLNQADVLVAVKCTPGGRHQNLQQVGQGLMVGWLWFNDGVGRAYFS